jgi:hypothetical protein
MYFIKLSGELRAFVYHCFDRMSFHGYLTGLSRPEHVGHSFRKVAGVPVDGKRFNPHESQPELLELLAGRRSVVALGLTM